MGKLVDVLTGEIFVSKTTAKQRRIFNWIMFELWLTLGTVVWLVFRNVLWFVGFMSLYAIIFGCHLIAWFAETPVEKEGAD